MSRSSRRPATVDPDRRTSRMTDAAHNAGPDGLPTFTFILPALNAAGSLVRTRAGVDSRPGLSAGASRADRRRRRLDGHDGCDAERLRRTVIENPNRLAEWGVKEGMLVARGEIVVIFAADNELVGPDWLQTVAALFAGDERLFAVYGRLVSGRRRPAAEQVRRAHSERADQLVPEPQPRELPGRASAAGRRLRVLRRRPGAAADLGRERACHAAGLGAAVVGPSRLRRRRRRVPRR